MLTEGSNDFRRAVFTFTCQLSTSWPVRTRNLLCAF